MKINKKLIPLKLHIFLANAGAAPIAPFMPVFGKQLGFSPISLGWIQTVCPILLVLIKPLAGAIIDHFKSQRFILMIFLMLSGIFGFSIQWIKPLPTSNNAHIKCNDSLVVTVCSEILKETFYAGKLKNALESSIECKASSKEKRLLQSFKVFNGSDTSSKNGAFSKSGDGTSSSESFDLNIQLRGLNKIQDGCATIEARASNFSDDICHSSGSQSLSEFFELKCSDELIQVLTKKSIIGDNEILSTYQFWCFSLLLIVFVISYCLANSTTDVIAFGLLGNKPENYGLQRLCAPVGWGLLSIISGVVVDKLNKENAETDYSSSFYIMLIIMTIDLFVISRIRVKIPEKSLSLKKDMKILFKNPKVITFAFWCFTNGFLFSFIWNFVLWYIEDLAAAGGSESKRWIKTLDGLSLAVQCFAGEMPFTFFAGKIMKKIGRINCMTLVLFGFGLRFLLYSAISNPWWILSVEPLHGISYGLMYATMTTHASAISPPGTETTVQNIFSCLFEGAGTATGGMVGGYLVSYVGVAKTFFILGISSVLLGFLHMITQKCLDRLEIKSDKGGRIYFPKEENTLKAEKETLNEVSENPNGL